MTRLMQSASKLTLAAALAAMPVFVMAQQATESTESDAEQAVEEVVQETGEAASEAAQAVGDAAESVGETIEAEVIEAEPEQTEGQAAATSEGTTEQTVTVTETPAEPEETEAQAVETVEPVTEETAAVTETPVDPVEGAITLQDEDSILTSDLLNAAVYNSAGEKVGDIDDAIVSIDGMVEGVVIGVGGFLGIGEKHVAVEMQQISVQTDEDGQPQLIIDTTRESLEAAPEFVTAETQRAEQAQQAPAGGMATSDTVPATDMTAPAEPEAEAEMPAATE